MGSMPDAVAKVAIVGLPNTGKTLIFNNLTGDYNLVANCPFTTICSKRKICEIGAQIFEIVDTPGIFKLLTYSESEIVTRDLLFAEMPDIIIQCIDAGQLKQSLTLTVDLLDLQIPLVICLNAIDETSRKGISIDSGKLSTMLHNTPVVESIATEGQGLDELKAAVAHVRQTRWNLSLSSPSERLIAEIAATLPEDVRHKRSRSKLLLMNDPFIGGELQKICGRDCADRIFQSVKLARERFNGNISLEMTKAVNNWIDVVVGEVVRRQKVSSQGAAERIAQACRHPVYGLPILVFIIYVMFLLVVNVANNIAAWMERVFWLPIETTIAHAIPAGFWQDFLIGDYGVLSLGVANALITVLPILSVFFILFNILEDMGYIPNLTVLTRKLFEKIGLSGASVMPLVLGFGCKTMATLTTRSVQSKREKYIAIYLIAFAIPCAAQMGLNMSILGRMGTSAFFIVFFVLVFVEITAGMLLNLILKKEGSAFMVQSLPPIRIPDPKAVMVKTYYKLYWFLKESLPVFIYAALALFALDRLGILTATKTFLSPVIKGFLGLPLEMVDALILCMARHEAAAGLIMNMIDAGKLNYVQCIVAVTITTMFVPCFANIMAMINELKLRPAMTMVLMINLSAFIIAGILNGILMVAR